jgi:transcriptional regulator with XRE-family HTH domain
MVANGSAPFGALLQRYRVAAGLSQAALAERAQLSARAISALERGLRRHPYLGTVRLLAEALALDAEQRAAFLAASRPERGTDPERREAPALPVSATPLLGREGSVDAVVALLTAGGARLVTLTGPGGVGKTRLALAVAERLQAQFADGVAFVDLASVRDPALVVAAIAHALGIGDAGDQPLPETLRQHLVPRRLLLLLDNFEQVLAAAAVLADLLAASPGLTLLVTSREPLHLQWEQEWTVPPLALPARESRAVGEIARSPAVALFVERARAVVSSFQFGAANAAAIADVCAQLDGLPLAIELAAARSKLLWMSSATTCERRWAGPSRQRRASNWGCAC